LNHNWRSGSGESAQRTPTPYRTTFSDDHFGFASSLGTRHGASWATNHSNSGDVVVIAVMGDCDGLRASAQHPGCGSRFPDSKSHTSIARVSCVPFINHRDWDRGPSRHALRCVFLLDLHWSLPPLRHRSKSWDVTRHIAHQRSRRTTLHTHWAWSPHIGLCPR
jgi:hypothetical protein